MSWLAKSLVNSLVGDDDEDDDNKIDSHDSSSKQDQNRSTQSTSPRASEEEEDPGTPSRGVKEDIDELTKTLARRFWGVASFLAPPPMDSPPHKEEGTSGDGGGDGDEVGVEATRILGLKNDLAEIGGRFRSGISKLSQTKAVSEISKIANSLLAFELDGEDEEMSVVGVNEEVLMFARSIAMHPGTWLDFPLLKDSDDFEMSDAQNEHALTIERLAPDLARLRIELCPSQMTEECFWKIYFVLLHPRLSEHEAELLSTQQILEARAMLLQDLKSQIKSSKTPTAEVSSLSEETRDVYDEEDPGAHSNVVGEDQPSKVVSSGIPVSVHSAEDDTEKHPVETVEVQTVDKSIFQEEPSTLINSKDLHNESSRVSTECNEEDVDDWLEDDTAEEVTTINATHPMGLEEDVSFSDLEDDGNDQISSVNLNITRKSGSESDDSKDWVQLNETAGNSSKGNNSSSSQSKGSNEWLDIEDIDKE